MKVLKIFIAAAAAAVIFTAALWADTINSIEQVEQTALLNNLEYKTAVLDVLKAENDLESRLKLDGSSISLSGSYPKQEKDDGSTGSSSASTPGLGWEASATLPVFEQLSLSASVDQDMTGTFGINLAPLSHSTTVQQSELSYSLKLVEAEEKAESTENEAVESYLQWSEAASDYSVKQKTVEVKQNLYDDEKVRYELGESTLDDVREAFTAWSDSRTTVNTAFSNLQTAEAGLYETLNIDPADFKIEPPAEADLFKLIEEIVSSLDTDTLSSSGSLAVLSAEQNVESLELHRKSVWLFEPELNIGGSLEISPAEPTPALSATAALSFGLDDWNIDEIEELDIELDISRMLAAQAVTQEQLNLKQALTNAETAAINYEIAEVALEQSEELLNEAEFLHGLGEYSEAELEETALQYEQSKNNLFAAAAEHYIALRSLTGYSM